MKRFGALTAFLAFALATAHADEPAGVVNLMGGKISNVETIVSVPIGADKSVVLGLHPGFWVQCPRYLPVPTSMTSPGVIVQFMLPRGGSPSLLYFGTEALPEAEKGETPAAREERAARWFVDGLRPKYEKVDFELMTAPVTVSATSIKVNGKKAKAWRTNRYRTQPAGEYGGPRSVLDGEGVLFRPEGSEVLVYILLDAKSSGTTLDRVLPNISVVPTVEVNKAGRIVQLNNLFEGADGRFPVRLTSYESPAGFVVAPSVTKLPGELVYAEDRLGPSGEVTASHRIRQVPASKDRTPAQDGEHWRTSFGNKDVGPLKQISLGTPGTLAWMFRHAGEVEGRASICHTAVLRFDDLTLLFDWHTFGDAALADKDGAAFEKLLAGMQLAVRW